MKRRNFILSTVFSLFTYKSFVHAFSRAKVIDSDNILISKDNGTCITLKSGMNYQLPDNPKSIHSCIHFKVIKSKNSKSPTITSKNHMIAEKNGQLIIDKDISIEKSRFFSLQYINEEFGWIVFRG
ncbi:hypothetical protein DAY19_03410 [Halobacteriovorax vibrionivorans]|uniref:Hedgehog/Intein (Hint) domain-containing protein n=1 Tax=Halobacteriovorax vibrionivorans TaxID=2152716 RepID=A0ABY0IK27_9BACT|nr:MULTISPECIES: hypothetical protein [Halobacteriovorax]RZF22834.1 hypothetical protein DAY19_03410 [Halobacteriovorax vibrionivorans]TGD47373.1 hypothetical protein EP118_08640 [Halobacteriovorax sp. Y22]